MNNNSLQMKAISVSFYSILALIIFSCQKDNYHNKYQINDSDKWFPKTESLLIKIERIDVDPEFIDILKQKTDGNPTLRSDMIDYSKR